MTDASAALQAQWRQTDYRVRLPGGGHASIRVGRPLPPPLLAQIPGDAPWLFITAWNPRSTPRKRKANRVAQRQLLAALRSLPATRSVCAAIGVSGDGHWREPSLFAVGPDLHSSDRLMRRFDQDAVVCGMGAGVAALRHRR